MTFLSETRHISQQYLVELGKSLDQKQISPAEFCTLCLVPQLLKNKVGFQKCVLSDSLSSDSEVMEFLRHYSWKGKSGRVRRSLLMWHQESYPLILWDRIPTPLELLKVQAKGERVITVFREAADWDKIHLGKTAWEFILHDLIHADHFFEKIDWRDGQRMFYQFLLEQWDHEMIGLARRECSEQFDYLISDMNSHPQHLAQTLTALCLMASKKSLGVERTQKLSNQQEIFFQNQMTGLFETCLFK